MLIFALALPSVPLTQGALDVSERVVSPHSLLEVGEIKVTGEAERAHPSPLSPPRKLAFTIATPTHSPFSRQLRGKSMLQPDTSWREVFLTSHRNSKYKDVRAIS